MFINKKNEVPVVAKVGDRTSTEGVVKKDLNPISFGTPEILGSLVIGEIVAWLLFIMVRVSAPELPIPQDTASSLSSLTTGVVLAIIFPILSVVGLYAAYFLARKIRIIYQAAKFILVGSLNTFIDLGILNLFILLTSVASGYLFVTFKGISFTIAVINSYFWNKHWTFKSKEDKTGKEFIQFIIVSVVGFIINIGTAALIVNGIGPQGGISETLWATIGALAAVVTSLGWNFIGYKFWVFKDQALENSKS